jgi:hypothetical protein
MWFDDLEAVRAFVGDDHAVAHAFSVGVCRWALG